MNDNESVTAVQAELATARNWLAGFATWLACEFETASEHLADLADEMRLTGSWCVYWAERLFCD